MKPLQAISIEQDTHILRQDIILKAMTDLNGYINPTATTLTEQTVGGVRF